MLSPKLLAFTAALVLAVSAQESPQVRVNYLNVCTPSDDEKKEIAAALQRISLQPAFAADFEVARGRSSMAEPGSPARVVFERAGLGDVPPSTWVRVRREFPPSAYLSNVQYSMTRDDSSIVETLVFRVRDPKDLLQIAISDSVTGTNVPAAVLAADTPAARVKLERFGKSSVVLARCPAAGQAAYDDLFRSASAVLAKYRDLLGIRRTVPAEFARIPAAAGKKKPVAHPGGNGAARPAAPAPAPQKR